MKKFKQYSALCIVFAFYLAGSLLLMFDYDTTATKWAAIITAFSAFGIGLWLGIVFNRKNLLPE